MNWCSMFHGSLLFALLFGVLARGPSGETNMPCFSGGSVHCWVPFYGWLLSASMICLHICKYHDLKLYVSRHVLPSLCYTVGMQWLFNGLHIIITSILMPTQWGPYPILTEHAWDQKSHDFTIFPWFKHGNSPVLIAIYRHPKKESASHCSRCTQILIILFVILNHHIDRKDALSVCIYIYV